MGGKRELQEERERRPLLVLVGPDMPTRFRTAKHLIDRDNAVVLCEGPPGCPLVRGERCAVVDTADAVVLLPNDSRDRELTVALSMCARHAAHTVVVDPTPVLPDVDALHVSSADAVVIAVPVALGGATAPGSLVGE